MTTWQLQHQADTEKGFQVREQVRQITRKGSQVRLCQPAEGQINDFPGQDCKHLNYNNNTYSANKHIPSIRVVLFNKGSLTPAWSDQCRLLVQNHLIKILNCPNMWFWPGSQLNFPNLIWRHSIAEWGVLPRLSGAVSHYSPHHISPDLTYVCKITSSILLKLWLFRQIF